MDKSNYNPFLTIIIPTFNASTKIKKALDSIVKQTFRNYEILVIDGLSSDSTVSIVKDFQKKYNEIKIFSEKDEGIYDAMNKGIKLAAGEWLYFLGSDDYFYSSNVLEEIFGKQHHKEYDVIYGNVYFEAIKREYDGEFTYSKLIGNNISHQAIFFNKKVFQLIGNFNIKYKSLADWDHNIRWFFLSKIKKKYINVLITFYGEGGFSSKFHDHTFYRDRNYKILRKGFFKIGDRKMLEICNNAIYYSRMDRSLSFGFWFILKMFYGIKLGLKSKYPNFFL